jgi:hypothetical protein
LLVLIHSINRINFLQYEVFLFGNSDDRPDGGCTGHSDNAYREEVQGWVLESGRDVVKYRPFEGRGQGTRSVPHAELYGIRYENLEIKGQTDAGSNYRHYIMPGTGTLVTSIISLLAGLVTAIIFSVIQPGLNTLSFPDPVDGPKRTIP